MKLKINGKECGLQWGMGAIEIYCDNMNCDIDGLDEVIKVGKRQGKAITNLILAALQNYCELNDQEFKVSYRQLQAWLDEAPQDQFKNIMDDWKASKYLGKTISEYMFGIVPDDNSVKKKSRSAKS